MPLTSPLLKTKFFPPPAISDFIEREEIQQKLDQTDSFPILLISAPTGYGKSTFVSEWLRKRKKNYTWLSLNKQENDFQQFIIYFTYAIHKKYNKIGEKILELSNAPEMPSSNELAEYFINHLSELDNHFYMVLDDYHLIRNKEVHEFLGKLLKYPLSTFSLILVTRRDPALPLSEWRLKNSLVEIRETDLRFKKNEIVQFFKNSLDVELKSTSIKVLQNITEGWISGLRLLILSLKNKDDINNELLNKDYHDSHIFRRLLSEVVNALPEIYRDYLLRLSVVEEFNQNLFSTICLSDDERKDAPTIFRDFIIEITNSNLFIIALDNKHQWYRFHHLITQLLQNQLLEIIGKNDFKELKAKVAQWFLSVNDKENGLKYLLKAEKYPEAIFTFSELKNELLQASNWHKLEHIYSWFPGNSVHCYTTLMLAQSWILIYKGNIPQMLDLIQPIEELMDKENLTDKERDSLTGEIHMLKAYGRYNFNIDMEACLYHSREAIQLIKEENSYALGLAWVFYGGAMQTMGKSEEAKKAIYFELTRHSPGNLKANLYLILCYIEWLEGHLDQLCKTASQMELLGEELNSKEILANSKYFKGIGYYFLNEIKKAEKELEVATYYQPFTLLVHGFFALAAMAYTKNELDDFNYAEKLLKELDKLATNRGGPHYVDFSRSITAELEWKQKKSADALKWATEKDFKPFIPMSNFLSGQLAQLKILATDTKLSSWQLAYDKVTEVIEFLRQTNNSNFLIRTLILQALVEYKLEHKIKASITFREAIEMASKRNFIQPFIHLKEELAPLFLELDEVTIPEDFLSLISPDDSAPETILTNREIEILHNMSENLSNKELGIRLFISESTVKRHIANIFKKLSAKNRREALARARELKVV